MKLNVLMIYIIGLPNLHCMSLYSSLWTIVNVYSLYSTHEFAVLYLSLISASL